MDEEDYIRFHEYPLVGKVQEPGCYAQHSDMLYTTWSRYTCTCTVHVIMHTLNLVICVIGGLITAAFSKLEFPCLSGDIEILALLCIA